MREHHIALYWPDTVGSLIAILKGMIKLHRYVSSHVDFKNSSLTTVIQAERSHFKSS